MAAQKVASNSGSVRARSLRRLMRPTYLAEYLGLAEDLGVQSRGDAEEVTHRGGTVMPRERHIRLDPAAPRELPEPCLQVGRSGPVYLETIAGGEQGCGTTGQALLLQPGRGFDRRKDK